MSFSFIKPQRRPVLSMFSKLWMVLISVVFLILLAVNFIMVYKNHTMAQNIQILATQQENLSAQTAQIEELEAKLKVQIAAATDLYTSNAILKKSLQNLFDLVPNSITVEEVVMEKSSLVIRGITPSKDVFNQLLASPLRSIFTTSNTSFFRTDNGWFGFISTNKIDNPEGYNE